MKKLLLIAVLLLALVFTFAACTTPGDTETQPESNGETVAPTDDGTDAPTDPVGTDPVTDPATDPVTAPETDPETDPVVETKPETKPETEPAPETEPETADPNVPVFMITPEDLVASQGCYDMGAPVLSEDGTYVTITPTGNDSYCYPFGNPTYLTGSRYVVIKYRTTNAEGMDIQIYMGSGTLASDNDMIQTGLIADGEWQLAILDASVIDGQTSDLTGGGTAGSPAGYYDGETVAFFRFDPMNCAYMLDENGLPYKLEDGSNWVRYDKPEGAYIDVAYIAFFSTEEGAKAYEYGVPGGGDASYDFTSDGASQADGTPFTDSDLLGLFQIADPTGGNPAVSGGLYNLPASIIHLVATTDGAYTYTVDIQSTSNPAMGGMFVRGYAPACHEGSYYGVLSADNINAFGGSGIYLNVNRNPADNSMALRIDIRSVDTTTGVLSTHVYEQYIDSGVITAADDGSTVYIMAGDKLIATVAISGEQVGYTNTYMGGSTAEIPAGALATTAVVTLADGTVETIENAAVAATCQSDVGIAVRTAALSFASVSLKGFSTATIPEDFTQVEPPVVDENAPAWDGDKAVVTHQSFDELRKNGDSNQGVFTAGQAAGWDKVAILDNSVTSLDYWGWISFYGEIGQFGYQIDKNEAVFDASFAFVGNDHSVIESQSPGEGDDHGHRMLINIDLSGLTGKHVINVFYKTTDGNMVTLNTFVVTIEEPAAPAAPMNVEKTTFTAGEDILVTAVGSGEQWVGIYPEGVTPGGGEPSIYWYYVDKDGHTSGEAVNIKTTNFSTDRAAYENLPAGNYTLIFFTDGGYTIGHQIAITVVAA